MMTPRLKPLLLSAALLGVLGTTATAWALGGHRGECAGMNDGPRAERMQERMAQRMSEKADRLKSALQLTPAQETAWQSFQTAMQAQPPGHANPVREPDQKAKLTAPQRMERLQALHQERQLQMAQRLAAVKAFYAVLTPEQQQVFDQQFHARGQRGGHGEGHRSHHRG